MSGDAIVGRLKTAIVCCLPCAISITTSLAVPLDVTVGFDGAAKGFVWTPVVVRMSNTSDEAVEGELSVVQPEGSRPYLAQCTARVSLPAHSKKLYHTYVRLSDFGGTMTVLLTRGNGLYGMKKINVDPFSKNEKLIVSVGGRTSRLNFLNGEQVPTVRRWDSNTGYSPGPSEVSIHAGSLSQNMLPDRPMAYDGVDALVLADLTPSAVDPKALEAIAMWVASGGTLVIPTGADYRRFQGEFYEELLPVSVEGAADLPGISSLAKLGGSPFPAGPVTVAKSAVKPGVGRVMAAEAGVPIVAERSYGAGTVIFLAFDHLGPPFRDWYGQTSFWKQILRRPAGTPMAASMAAAMDEEYFSNNRYNYGYAQQLPELWQGLGSVVAQNPSVRAPSFSSIGLFLLAYLVMLVPVNYFVLRRMRRLELAWVSTPVIVIVFVLGAYGMGYTMKGSELRLCQAMIIEGSSGERYARVVSGASLFSPARRAYDLTISDPHSLSQVVPATETERLPVAFLDETSRIDRVGMAMWSSRSFESLSGADLGGTLESDLVLEGNRLRGTVTNKTGMALRDCKLTYGQSSMDVPDLPIGTSTKIDVSYQAFRAPGYSPSPGIGKFGDRLHTYALSAAQTSNSPVLVATPAVDGTVFRVSGDKASAQSAVRAVLRLRYRAGGTFTIHDSMMARSIVRSNGMNVEGPSNVSGSRAGTLRVSFYGNGSCVAGFRMQIPPGGRVTALKLDLAHGSGGMPGPGGSQPTSGAPPVELAIYNRSSGAWDVAKAAPTAVVRNSGEYVSPDGEVRVRLKQLAAGSASVVLDMTAEGVGR